MANQFVKTDSFRQKIVNKRIDPAYKDLTEILTDFRPLTSVNNQITQWYVILNECIYNEDASDFRITYTSGGQEVELVINTDYTLNVSSAVVTFKVNLDPHELNNLTAYYKGGGSIIWAEDVTDLQKVISTIDTNAVYTNGSNYMTADLYMGNGTYENPNHSIKNVDTVDNIKVSTHNHTGLQNGVPIPSAGIENNAILESKIASNAVTNSKIANSSITNNKISSGTITIDKVSSVSIGDGLKRVPTTIDGVTVNNALLQTNIDNSTIVYNNGVMQIPAIINLTGVVLPFAGSGTSIPTGWLLCDGKSYLISQYPKLFAVIGYTYGGSDSTFKVPNFVGKTFWGGIDNDGIENQDIPAGIPNHYHIFGSNSFHGNAGRFVSTNFQNITADTVDTLNSKGSVGWNGSGHDSAEFSSSETFSGCMITTLVKQSATEKNDGVYGKSDTVQPAAIRMKFIIKT